ncbi:TetR/AcrR family transcriptional regulator [Tomitella gaofuii]|uniref:TetR/AcrR family transcriptional regulator n=1 Tax=Tomitella gaofuii TaxID=2760083 RepID=UPI0015FC8D4D|nr:TetR/AcrR family transcriptional regulator [Tomitella gaofuii]
MASDVTRESHQVIWMRPTRNRRGPRPAHSREDLTRAAVDIADEHGLDEVTLRAVAGRLGTGAATLYRYIETKRDLHDLMVDAVSAEYALPSTPTGEWRADLRALADQARVIYRRHPWALTLSADAAWGPHVQAFMEYFLAVLAATELSLREQTELIAQFTSTVATFAAHESRQSRRSFDSVGDMARVEHFQQIAQDSTLPRLATVVRSMLTEAPPDVDDLFRHTVDRLLDSVEPRGPAV